MTLLFSRPTVGEAMGWLEKKMREQNERVEQNIRASMPLIKRNADHVLSELGHDPATLAFAVFATGKGEEDWTVKYWANPPRDYVKQVAGHADLEAYLNHWGRVLRVVGYEEGKEQLLYGKDERIENGMTPAQVRERLGEPDYKGPPPRNLRDLADEMWKYKVTQDRTVRIEVFFKDGKVASVDTFGE